MANPADAIGGAITRCDETRRDARARVHSRPTLIIVGAEDMLTTRRAESSRHRVVRSGTTRPPPPKRAREAAPERPTRKRPSMTREPSLNELAEQRATGNAGMWK